MDTQELLDDLRDAESVSDNDIFQRAIDAVRELQRWEETAEALFQRGFYKEMGEGPWKDRVAGLAFSAGMTLGENYKLKAEVGKYRERLGLEPDAEYDEADLDVVDHLENIQRSQARLIRVERWLLERIAQNVGIDLKKFREEHLVAAVTATAIGTTAASSTETGGQHH